MAVKIIDNISTVQAVPAVTSETFRDVSKPLSFYLVGVGSNPSWSATVTFYEIDNVGYKKVTKSASFTVSNLNKAELYTWTTSATSFVAHVSSISNASVTVYMTQADSSALERILLTEPSSGTKAMPSDVVNCTAEYVTGQGWIGNLGVLDSKAVLDSFPTNALVPGKVWAVVASASSFAKYNYMSAGWALESSVGPTGSSNLPGSPSNPFTSTAERNAAYATTPANPHERVWVNNLEYEWLGGLSASTDVDWTASGYPEFNQPVLPDTYFGGSANIPVGWLATMVTAGVKNIGLLWRTYPLPSVGFIETDGLKITGTKRAVRNNTDTALEFGTIVSGGFQFVRSKNITISNLGVDGGDAYTGTNPNDGHLIFDRGENIDVSKITVLSKSVNVRALGAHCMLFQGITNGVSVIDCEVTYGTHGYAMKSNPFKMDKVIARKSIYGITLKSDTVATGTGYKCADGVITNSRFFDTGDAAGGMAITIGPGSSRAAGQEIANIVIDGCSINRSVYNGAISHNGIGIGAQVADAETCNLTITNLTGYNATFLVSIDQAICRAVSFGKIVNTNGSRTFLTNVPSGSDPITISDITDNNVTTSLQIDGYSKVICGAVNKAGGGAQVALLVGNNSRFKLGTYNSTTVPLFPTTTTTYQNSCTDYSGDGATPLRLTMAGGNIVLRGKIVPGTASSQSNYSLFTIPNWAYPGSLRTFTALAIVSGSPQFLALDISTAGVVSVKSLPASTTYISVDGISWEPGA